MRKLSPYICLPLSTDRFNLHFQPPSVCFENARIAMQFLSSFVPRSKQSAGWKGLNRALWGPIFFGKTWKGVASRAGVYKQGVRAYCNGEGRRAVVPFFKNRKSTTCSIFFQPTSCKFLRRSELHVGDGRIWSSHDIYVFLILKSIEYTDFLNSYNENLKKESEPHPHTIKHIICVGHVHTNHTHVISGGKISKLLKKILGGPPYTSDSGFDFVSQPCKLW